MQPIEFAHQNVTFAEDQPEYRPLPAWRGKGPEFEVITCWSLSWRDRFKLLFSGKLWLRQLTFGEQLQPQLPELETPFK